MIKKMYCLFDKKIEAYGNPMPYINEDSAKGELAAHLNHDKEDINAADYELYFIGDFDTNTGKYKTPDVPLHILNCRELMYKPETQTKETAQ